MGKLIDERTLINNYIDKIVIDKHIYFHSPEYHSIISCRVQDYIQGINDAMEIYNKYDKGEKSK